MAEIIWAVDSWGTRNRAGRWVFGSASKVGVVKERQSSEMDAASFARKEGFPGGRFINGGVISNKFRDHRFNVKKAN